MGSTTDDETFRLELDPSDTFVARNRCSEYDAVLGVCQLLIVSLDRETASRGFVHESVQGFVQEVNIMKSLSIAVLLVLLISVFPGALSGQVVINEVRIDQSGSDADEYFELAGPAGQSLTGLSYIVLGDSSAG